MDHQKIIKSPEIVAHKYSQLIIDKRVMALQQSKMIILINGADLAIHIQKKKNLDTSFTKINSKWTTNLKVKCKSREIIRDNRGKS